MSKADAVISRRRKIPAIWFVPIVALALGGWMVVYTALNEGPEITIKFATAEGIEAGKTKIKSRSVLIGLVESVTLNDDLESVTVTAKLELEAEPLLREDTRFWVVRPRIGVGGVSGLGTLMSGAYLELEPGSGEPSRLRAFVGLDDVPATPKGTPGLGVVLVANQAGSLGPGAPVLYRGFTVGRIEETVFDADTKHVRHRAFIDAPYDSLVNTATRFWNASGISIDASSEGIHVDIGSMQTLLSGGVSFDMPEGVSAGGPVESGSKFVLHDGYESTTEEIYLHYADYVVSFTQSVRGLEPGAPVEYRGVRVGTVGEILLEQLVQARAGTSGGAIPVLIRVEPGRIKQGDNEESLARMVESIERGVGVGMRASLQSGNLLTGSLYVTIDYYPEEGPGELGSFAGYPTIPTLSGGLVGIERKISQLLTKLNNLPLEKTIRELNATLVQLRELASANELDDLAPALITTLTEIDRTLQGVQSLTRTVEEQPNSLIFSVPNQPDPVPQVRP